MFDCISIMRREEVQQNVQGLDLQGKRVCMWLNYAEYQDESTKTCLDQ